MPYSCKFIPYKGLKTEVDVGVLLDNADFSIARRCDYSTDILRKCGDSYLIPQDSNILEEFYERLPSMSMTYVYDEESLESASYRLHKPACDKWNGENVNLVDCKNSIEKKDPCFQLVFSAKKLHNISIPYSKKFGSLEDFVKHNIEEAFAKDKTYPVVGKIILQHSPTQLNYYHFELMLLDDNGNPLKNVSSLQKALANPHSKINGRDCFALYVLDQMTKYFEVNHAFDGTSSLPESLFCDNGVLPEDREKNRIEMQNSFKDVTLEIS